MRFGADGMPEPRLQGAPRATLGVGAAGFVELGQGLTMPYGNTGRYPPQGSVANLNGLGNIFGAFGQQPVLGSNVNRKYSPAGPGGGGGGGSVWVYLLLGTQSHATTTAPLTALCCLADRAHPGGASGAGSNDLDNFIMSLTGGDSLMVSLVPFVGRHECALLGNRSLAPHPSRLLDLPTPSLVFYFASWWCLDPPHPSKESGECSPPRAI